MNPKRSSKAIEKETSKSPPENALHSSRKKEEIDAQSKTKSNNPEPIRILFLSNAGKRFFQTSSPCPRPYVNIARPVSSWYLVVLVPAWPCNMIGQ
jgi:hypothetical protein